MREYEQDLERNQIAVAIVTFDDSPLAQNYVRQTHLQWPLLLDPERELYHGYGMERVGAWAIYGPGSIWHYLKLLFRGNKLHRPGKDYHQIGGDVIVDPAGVVRYQHVSRTPHDRPSPEEMWEVLELPAPLQKSPKESPETTDLDE